MESSVCIVGGCGHIGLPLGMALAEVGVPVTLFDIDVARVRLVAAGQMPFLECGAERILPHLLSTDRLKVTTSPELFASMTSWSSRSEHLSTNLWTPMFDRSIAQLTAFWITCAMVSY
jgi:UDP-N-acetyl-D-mannosaminuronate dehydrogenase